MALLPMQWWGPMCSSGVSVANALTPEMVKTMDKDPIVSPWPTPLPEIDYETAIQAGVKVMGTGRSDKPNQINNVLASPAFSGVLWTWGPEN